jgi:hypothetical protein
MKLGNITSLLIPALWLALLLAVGMVVFKPNR